jgi:hypothetical protein
MFHALGLYSLSDLMKDLMMDLMMEEGKTKANEEVLILVLHLI